MSENQPNTDQKSEVPVRCAFDRMVDVVALVPNPRNPNKHPKSQIELLAKIIKHQGWRSPIVVSKRSGFIVAGHGRYEAAKVLGLQSVPVDDQDFASEADEHAHLIADNRLHELSEIDRDSLATLIRELDAAVQPEAMGFDRSEVNELLSELTQAVSIKPLDNKPPPKMAWTLIGIPVVRFSEINSHVEQIAKVPGVICEQTVNDGKRDGEES